MTQTYQKTKGLDIIEVEKYNVQIFNGDQMDKLLGELNPKYFEESHTLSEAKQRIHTINISVGSKFDFFSAF
ncbi:MAG: hypothetical protein ACFE8B_09135 [Candidatus Hermodarchaeota archaeon]